MCFILSRTLRAKSNTMLDIFGGDYQVRVQEFPQAAGTIESTQPPSAVTDWVSAHQPTVNGQGEPVRVPVPGGSVDRIFNPMFLGAIGTGNPGWIICYVVWMNPRH